jgi:DNA-binding CsgD family transcriptional regulator
MKLIETELIQREDQLGALTDLFTDCLRGRGRIARISGSVASGKTLLLQTFEDQAVNSGAVVLTAVATRAEQTLPLSVVSQLLRNAAIPPELARHFAQLLDDGTRTTWLDPTSEALEQATAPVLHGLCTDLLELSEHNPLVIAVDDAHYADLPSLQCLSYLARRCRAARVLLLFAESSCLEPKFPLFNAEFLRNTPYRSIQVEPLTPRGVSKLLSQCPNGPAAHLAPDYHALTGGSPLLLQALIEDHRLAGQSSPEALPIGDTFSDAVLSCLHACEPTMLRVAQALAVLGEPTRAGTLGRLLDVEGETASRAVQLLDRAGILDAGRFRHPRARDAVLAGIPPAARAALHRHVARLLHSDGEPAPAVARHLVMADGLDATWAQPTLQEAAEHALAEGDVDHAVACLRLARDASGSPQQQAEATSMLAHVEWRLDPSNALRHLPELAAAARDGHLNVRQSVAVNYLLWHGYAEEASEALRALCSTDNLEPRTAGGLSISLLWLAYVYPEYAEHVRHCGSLLARKNHAFPLDVPRRAVAVLTAMMAQSPNGHAVAAAEQGLKRIGPDDEALGPICVSLSAMFFADPPNSSTCFCEPQHGTAAPGRTGTCHAVASAVNAEMALRLGDLTSAEQYARTGLDGISPKGWGVAIGSLLSTAVLAACAAGNYDVAARYLGTPVPEGMFSTPFGLKYLYARSRYYLATDRIRAAVSDLQMCRNVMTTWGLDLPALVPWRTELAQAYLMLGRHAQSRELAQEQLRRLPDGATEMRGMTLRVLAGASDPSKRPRLLRQAIDLLQQCGNRAEVAAAFKDLGNALHQIGEPGHARTMLRTARKMAPLAHARAEPAPGVPSDPTPAVAAELSSSGITELSEAERRVAALAALGCTNREISSKLYVTVSTVEQHLTRVYRKLQVNRRSDLPAELQLYVADPASPEGSASQAFVPVCVGL